MGRYDGEDYEVKPPCPRFEDHNWAMNGHCWRCGWTRRELERSAQPNPVRPVDVCPNRDQHQWVRGQRCDACGTYFRGDPMG